MHALIYPQKQDTERAQYRPPEATTGGPVPNAPQSPARASDGPCPAPSTTFSLEQDSRSSRGGSNEYTKTSQTSGLRQE